MGNWLENAVASSVLLFPSQRIIRAMTHKMAPSPSSVAIDLATGCFSAPTGWNPKCFQWRGISLTLKQDR